MVEIRWHGRGGQGAKTAAILFGEVAMSSGKYIQAFPEYGPERRGAPVRAFNRLDDNPILLHSSIDKPDVVVVLDPSLIEPAKVIEGLKEDGILLINTPEQPAEVRKKYKIKRKKISTVDASKISKETIGRELPNTPMLGALVKITKFVKFNRMTRDLKIQFKKKFRGNEKLIKGNINSIERAYKEVVSE